MLAIDQLNVDDPPTANQPSIGFAPPVPAEGQQGFAVASTVTVHNCSNPAEVNVQFYGSAGYWTHAAKTLTHNALSTRGLKQAVPLAFAVQGPRVSDVKLALLPSSSDPPRKIQDTLFSVTPPTGQPSGGDIYVVGSEVHQWNYLNSGVQVTLKADWVYPRTNGSCYVLMPALISPSADCATGTAEAAMQGGVSGHPSSDAWFHDCADDDQTESVEVGSNALIARGNAVDAADSLPPPTRTAVSTWTCHEVPQPSGTPFFPGNPKKHLLPVVVQGMADLSRYDASNSDCSSIVELTSSDGGTASQLFLLLAGALIAVGAATAFDLGRRALLATNGDESAADAAES